MVGCVVYAHVPPSSVILTANQRWTYLWRYVQNHLAVGIEC